jgi:tetratricopeptide (TPR) repeat protein
MDNSNSQVESLFFQADQKIKEGLFAEAKDLLRQAITLDPKFGRAYNHLGWLYETKYQDYKKAEEFYRQALEFSPEYPAIYINLAILLSTLEKNQELEKHLQKALTVLGINKSSIYREFGFLYERQGLFDKAIESFKNGLLYSLTDDETEKFKLAIERCKQKQEIIGSIPAATKSGAKK